MSLRTRIVVSLLTLSSLALLVACGSSGPKVVPPPTGGFSNSNLNGTYVFSTIGADSIGNFLAITGTVSADGTGKIVGGQFDVSNPGGAGILLGVPIGVKSSYNITADGRGKATLQTSQGTFTFNFVMTSSEHGLITLFDTGGTGSGSIDLQSSSVTQLQLAQPYTVSLNGLDITANPPVPMASVAAFTLDAAGNMSNGVQDINDIGTALPGLSLTGTVLVGAGGAPGTAQLNTQTTLGTLTFDVFPIDSNHLKLIETDGVAILSGDAFPQLSSTPTGTNVFTLAGLDFGVSGGAPFVAGGFLVTDGNGNVMNSSLEDLNDVGTITTGIGFTGTYTGTTNGRSVLTLLNFNNASLSSTTVFAAYPSAGGLQLLEIDNGGITSGVASLQSSTSLASSEGYGLNLTATNMSQGLGAFFEEDDIAEFTNNNGSLSGIVDFNDMGSLAGNKAFSGTYATDGTSSGRGQVTSNSFNLISYVVDGNTSMFIEQDGNQVGVGAYQRQDANAKSSLAMSHLRVLSLKPGAAKTPAIRRR